MGPVVSCTCIPGALCSQHEAERRRYLRRTKAEQRSEERRRYTAKRKANPQLCADCDRVRTMHVIGERLCGACYMRRRRLAKA